MSDPILDQWLDSGTIRTEQVNLFADQAIMAEMQKLIERRTELEESTPRGQRAMGEANPFKELEREEAALWEKYEASKSVWTVRALLPEETDAIHDEFPEPPAPQMLPKAAPAKAKEAWAVERDAFVKQSQQQAIERDLRFVATATIKVETAHGTVDAVSVEQVRAMRAKQYGPDRVRMLVEAITRSTVGEEEMPRPKSSNGSESTEEQ